MVLKNEAAWKLFCDMRRKNQWPNGLPVNSVDHNKATMYLDKYVALHRAAGYYQRAVFTDFIDKTAGGYSAFLGLVLAWSAYNCLYNVPWNFKTKGTKDMSDAAASYLVLPKIVEKCPKTVRDELTASASECAQKLKRYLHDHEKFEKNLIDILHGNTKDRVKSFLDTDSNVNGDVAIFIALTYALRNSVVHGHATPAWFSSSVKGAKILNDFKATLLTLTNIAVNSLITLKEV